MTGWDPERSWEPGPPDGSTSRATGIPWAPGQPDQPVAPPPPPSRRPSWWILAVVVVLVAAGVVTGLTRPWSDAPDRAGPTSTRVSTPASADSPSASLPPATPTDLFVKYAKPGDCVAMTDRLDGSAGADAEVVDCGDRATTFTVVKRYSKPKSATPCTSDAAVRSDRAEAVACLDRVLSAGQCVLGNGTSPFFASAVPCDLTPSTPFTEVLRVEAIEPAGTPLTCAAGATTTAVSGRSVCVRRVTG